MVEQKENGCVCVRERERKKEGERKKKRERETKKCVLLFTFFGLNATRQRPVAS